MFTDEARFGRMNRIRPLLGTIGTRPTVAAQFIREYIDLYGAVATENGTCVYLIMPTSNTACFQAFLDVRRASLFAKTSCWFSTCAQPPLRRPCHSRQRHALVSPAVSDWLPVALVHDTAHKARGGCAAMCRHGVSQISVKR
jgi:hypothetical protein